MAQEEGDTTEHDAEATHEEKQNRELLADRERLFDRFVHFAAWNVVLGIIVVAFLALTQT